MVRDKHILSFWELGIWISARQKVTPIKTPGHWVSNELLWFVTFHMCCHISLWGELNISMWLHWERTFGSLHLVSLHSPRAIIFLFAVWAFAIVNHQHEYNYELNPMSHDSHSSSSDAVILPCCSNQSESASHPSSTKADRCCCHFLRFFFSP